MKPKTPTKDQSKIRTMMIPDDLWDRLRIQAIREKRSASEILRELVLAYLDKVEGKRR